MRPGDLEPLIDRVLKALPAPTPPVTLLPRVMAAVRAESTPWYTRPWLVWPREWQVASAAALLAIVTGIVLALPAAAAVANDAASHAAGSMPPALSEGIARIASTAEQAETTGSALRVVWRMVFVPSAVYALVLVGLMYATFAAFATVLTRVACRRVQPQ